MNDRGDAVKSLQRGLNKLGAMLLVDGHFGSGTGDAVAEVRLALGKPGPREADEQLQAAVAAAPDPFPPLTAAGITFVAQAEVSDAATYRKKFQGPCWPSDKSGITIGIGYDCQFVSADQLRNDWSAVLDSQMINTLAAACGKVGSRDMLASVKGVVIPLPVAMSVFVKRSLARYLQHTRDIYPQIDDSILTPAQRTALVSLVYNRGTRLTDNNAALQERREMRTIQSLLAAGSLDAVADQLESMTRLWDPTKLGGLIKRRRDEALLWRRGFTALQLD
jgi:hypothetical protein